MLESKFMLWIGMMFPLVFSAGPANVTMASMGARFGVFKSLPFISGINLIVLLHAVVIGFGAGTFLEMYPDVFKYLQYGGSVYLIYLATKFYKSSRPNVKKLPDNIPNFMDGVVLQLLNMKVVAVTVVMFSQFLDVDSGQLSQVLTLSLGIALLTTGATISWAAGGAWLIKKFVSEDSARLQGYIFGTMLVAVSVWMLI